MNAVRAAALAASLAVIAATSWAHEAARQPCKNHYILRCESSFEWNIAAAPLLHHGVGASATLLEDGRVLLAGGGTALGAEIYDPKIDRWTLAAPMNVERVAHRAISLRDGRVLIVGGNSNAPTLGSAPRFELHRTANTAEIYDPATDAWTLTPPLNFDRYTYTDRDLTANLLPDGSVLVTGGHDSYWYPLAETEIYDPATDTWRVTGSLASSRVGHTATTLADGTILVVGGLADWEYWSHKHAAELYDPAIGQWRLLGPMPPRVNHSATLHADGSILVAGGQTFTPIVLSRNQVTGLWPAGSTGSSFLYYPVGGETISLASPAAPRHSHLAVTIPGGLLAVGGRLDRMPVEGAYSSVPVLHNERYDSESQTWSTIQEIGDPPHEPYSATHLGEGRILVIGPLGAYLLSY